MTKEQIETMEGGTKLDELIAEKVMGWKRAPEYQFPNWLRPDGCWVWSSAIMPYSTNIAHAWDVVEELRFNGLDVWLHLYADFGVCEIFQRSPNQMKTLGRHQNEAIPLAICRAALLATLEQ